MEKIIKQWEMEKADCQTYLIKEVEDDGEIFFDVCLPDDDCQDSFNDYREAVEAVNNAWQTEIDRKEEEEYNRATNVPDSIWSLGLYGMFGV